MLLYGNGTALFWVSCVSKVSGGLIFMFPLCLFSFCVYSFSTVYCLAYSRFSLNAHGTNRIVVMKTFIYTFCCNYLLLTYKLKMNLQEKDYLNIF